MLRAGLGRLIASGALPFLFAFTAPDDAQAGPDKCSTSGSTATCQGNQSAGVKDGTDFSASTETVLLQSLSTNVTPASTVPGVNHFAQPNSGISGIVVKFNGGSFAINTTGSAAHGILAGGQGHSGGGGSFGSFSSGGTGGNGGGLGTLSVTSNGTITTNGTGAHGISVQGLSGNSGGGGDSSCCNGGSGGDGFGGTSPQAMGSGSITANGDQSAGIYVIYRGGNGGGGGEGGLAGDGGHGGAGGVGPNFYLNNTGNWSIATNGASSSPGIRFDGIAGSGGGGGTGYDGGHGGNGGAAYYTQPMFFAASDAGSWTISTKGTSSEGLYVSLVGGNGGHGGTSVTDSGAGGGSGGQGAPVFMLSGGKAQIAVTTLGDSSSGIRLLNVGGNGGNGGSSDCCNGGNAGNGANGGEVLQFGVSTLTAQIQTSGNQSHGVFLVSQGGSGGNGGSAGVAGSGKNGGGGGGGGSITVSGGTYDITTSGTQAHGIGVFSLGGPGGKGSDGGFFNPVSGGGGSTGTSGTVSVTAGGTILTRGAESYGIFVQSVAGHAGDAGSAGSLVSFEASGGSAGAGGQVTVTSSATITTVSDQSAALVAQSIGGGGGSGGSGFAFFYGSGGSGSIGGAGGTVTVTNSGALTTSGDDAHGIYAQSIGGTGGDGGVEAGTAVTMGGGGANASNGGSVKVVNSATIQTGAATSGTVETGPDPTCGTGCSSGIFAQSIGGGGGNGGSTGGVIASVGGAAGGGGAGGSVEVDNTGRIGTTLINSHAIAAQSVGGGGGHGGGAVTASPGLAIAIGGKGGGGGGAGTVTVNSTRGAALSTAADWSHGILAQSSGGSGGRGGFAVALAANQASGSFAIGGQGAIGGDGQAVTVNTVDTTYSGPANSISTKGQGSSGIFAQSHGGGGGDGGFAISAAAGSTYGGLAFSIGGNGGAAGAGAAVVVTSDADITTAGSSSDAIKAQSIGGGGGNGTFAASGALSLSGASVSVAVGGKGGAGGAASTVDVTSSGTILTTGDGARGISALSGGGGGGHGGLTISGSISTGSGGLSLGVGQAGGKGGNAAGVTVTNHGAVTTQGNKAIGIEAQSVGGGGGRGSMAFAATATGSNSIDIGVAIGGSGGVAGSGGAVSVTNTGAIKTGATDAEASDSESVTDAYGIFAQSVGGTGGSGGLAGAISLQPNSTTAALNTTVAVGGNGGSGSLGGQVTVSNSGTIDTLSDSSHGVFAQSVGGSGGAAGSAFAVSLELADNKYAGVFNLAFAVGGKGGSGSTGGEVDVTNSGAKISTAGAASHGIYAHSVGGSGGSGGSAYTMAYTFNPQFFPPGADSGVNLQVGIGGNGGSGNNGGVVKVTNSGAIQTQGPGSYGIFAYSIGGGGGDGGSASGLPTIPFTDRVKIYKNVVIEVGGKAGSSGSGGAVTVKHTAGDISTNGAGSPGIVAQSVGGGGGTGGNGAVGATGTVAIGGTGGAAGDGGDVDVEFSGGNITTLGGNTSSSDPSQDIDSSYGIFAQSVGGGGGQAGNATFFGIPDSTSGSDLGGVTIGIGFGIDLAGGNAGNGGKITVNAAGDITTSGPNAVGIFAQSVGGGGGVSGNLGLGAASGGAAMVGSVGGQGSGDTVAVTYQGDIATAGGGAHGIFAQSVGPDGAGTVTVEVTGSVVATGADAHAILAQSVKKLNDSTSTGAANITVTLNNGAVVKGGKPGTNNNGAAVQFLDGVNNLLTTNGTLSSVNGIQGYAVAATGGNDSVVNNGHMIGNVDLGDGANKLNIDGSGRYDSGATVIVGSGNALNNYGILSPGGDDALLTTALTGNLVQTSGGSYIVTLDGAQINVNDRVDVSGSADMSGTVQVSVIDAGTGTVQSQTTIVQANGGVSAATAQNLTVTPSAVGNFGLVFSNTQKVDLTYAIDFSNAALSAGLNDNQEAVADELDALHGQGLIHRDLLYLLRAEDTGAYGEALDHLSPEPYAVSEWAAVLSSQQFNDALMSCRERSGDDRFIREGQCLRLGLQGRRFERDASGDSTGYRLDSAEISLGAQKALSEQWHLGFGLAYETWDADTSEDLWRSDADQFQGGIVLKHQIGATLLAASASAGIASVDVVRNAAPGQQAKGDQDVRFAGGQLRVAHAFERGSWYLKPRTDLSLTYVDSDDVDEDGGGATALAVEGDSELYAALQPALELGGEVATADGYLLRPRMALGITHFLDDPSPRVEARFLATPAAGSGFKVTSEVERTTLDLELGLDVISTGGVTVGLGGFGQFAKDQTHAGGSIRLTVPF
ncbi:MAG TPA: hypothetical protein PKA13_20265 [Geminicoccaceae bacterium]|nr:hypothetical protein [Geminicoccus sp.]HMU52123.1 hypothetical protein [Geminicoccaceae bacterium]